MAIQTPKPIYETPPGPNIYKGPCTCGNPVGAWRRHHDGVTDPTVPPAGCDPYYTTGNLAIAFHDWCSNTQRYKCDAGQSNWCADIPAGFPTAPNDYVICGNKCEIQTLLAGGEEVHEGLIVGVIGWPSTTTWVPSGGGGKHYLVIQSHNVFLTGDGIQKVKMEHYPNRNSSQESFWGGLYELYDEINIPASNNHIMSRNVRIPGGDLPVLADATNRVCGAANIFSRVEIGWRRKVNQTMQAYWKFSELGGSGISGATYREYPIYDGTLSPRVLRLGNVDIASDAAGTSDLPRTQACPSPTCPGEIPYGSSCPAFFGQTGIDRGRTYWKLLRNPPGGVDTNAIIEHRRGTWFPGDTTAFTGATVAETS